MNKLGKQLTAYYRALHDEARRYSKIRNVFYGGVVIFLMGAIYAQGYCLYLVSLAALIMQAIGWFYNYKSLNSSSLALDFQKISMLHDAYGQVPSNFYLSHLQSSVSLSVSSRVSKIIEDKETDWGGDLYNIKNKSSPESSLLSMIQENAFWNHHLYGYSFNLLAVRLLLAILVVIAVSLSLIPVITTDPNYSLPRLAFTVLSLAIIYEWVETALNYRKASAEMLELDNEVSRIVDNQGNHSVLRLFSKYNLIQDLKLNIPDKIYQKNRSRLNSAWNERVDKEKTKK